MSLLMSIGLVVQVLSAIALIVLVLLQHGKGADLGAAFGSGASGSIFGAAGSGSFLSKMTWIIGAVFFLSTIAITIGSGAFAHHNAPAPAASNTADTRNNPTTPSQNEIPR